MSAGITLSWRSHITCTALLIAASGFVYLVPLCSAQEGTRWINNIDVGKKEANATKKDLFLVFTGTEWCHACSLFDREVLKQPRFIEEALKTHVLVEFMSPRGDTPEEDGEKSRFKAIAEKYLVVGVPTVVLSDADGVPYTIMTGYDDEGSNAEKIDGLIERMRSAQTARRERDRYFQTAKIASGADRAAHLHRGLQAVADRLEADRREDPILFFYRSAVEDILKTDSENSAIREQYLALQKKRDAWVLRESVFAKLKEFNPETDNKAAIAYLDEQIKQASDADIRWRLEWSRQVRLEWDSQFDEALANARRLLNTPDISAEDREELHDREAFNLVNSGRVEEAAVQYDRQIAAVQDDPKKYCGLLRTKAEMLRDRQHPELAIAACRAWRAATAGGTQDWLQATYTLATELKQIGEHREALKLFEELIAIDNQGPEWGGWTWAMVHAVECHFALREYGEAQGLIERATVKAAELKESATPSSKVRLASLEKQLQTLRDQLAGHAKP